MQKICEKIRFEKLIEIEHCLSLAKLFILKTKSEKVNKLFKINITHEPFLLNILISKKPEKTFNPRSKNLILSFLGKKILLEGSVIKTKKKITRVGAILIECEKCGSIFYFILDSLHQFLPFLCSKANCISRKFFSHFSRIIEENFQKIKIGKISINFKKLKSTESFTLNIFGNKNILRLDGLNIFCEAQLKLHPIFKKSFSFFEKKLLFGIHFESHYLQNPFRLRLGFGNNCFLTKKEFILIYQIISTFDPFHLFIKNMKPICNKNEGLKACLILLMSQQIKNSEKIPNNDFLYSFLFVSISLISDISFLKELSKSFPRSFFFNCDDFKDQFNPKYFKESTESRRNLYKFKNSVFFINIISEKKRLLCTDSNIDFIKKSIKKNKWIFKKSLFVFFTRMEKKSGKNLKFFSERNKESFKNLNISSLFYVLRKNNTELNRKTEAFEILNYQNIEKKNSFLKQNKSRYKLNRLSIFNNLIFKKRISRLFFKKYLNLLQSFPDSNLTVSSFELILFLYKKIKNFDIGFLKSPLNFLIIIQKFCQCRAKIDLRNQIRCSDIFDGIEILFDSDTRILKNLMSELNLKKNEIFKKLSLTQKLLKLFQKFFYRSGQTLFETKVLEKNFEGEVYFSEVIKVLKILALVKELKKSLILINI